MFICRRKKDEYGNSKYCKDCINTYGLINCDSCGEYNPREMIENETICINCKWRQSKLCKNCDAMKLRILFLDDDNYCGECQTTMLKGCDGCKKEIEYYKLDQGKYCVDCQQNIMVECNGCQENKKYNKYYYSQTREICEECVIETCLRANHVLIKYGPKV